jgi:hypothetical protein
MYREKRNAGAFFTCFFLARLTRIASSGQEAALQSKKIKKVIYFPHPKIRGEWVELRFMTRAIELRFRPSCPWRDSAPYDVVTEFRGRFRRIQSLP